MRARLNLAIGFGILILYCINQFLLKPRIHGGFVHNHLNDIFASIILLAWSGLVSNGHRAERRLRSLPGIIALITAASIVWEVITPAFLNTAIGDPIDAICYFTGGLIFWFAHNHLIGNAERENLESR